MKRPSCTTFSRIRLLTVATNRFRHVKCWNSRHQKMSKQLCEKRRLSAVSKQKRKSRPSSITKAERNPLSKHNPETSTVVTHADEQPDDRDQLKQVAQHLAGRTAVTKSGELDLMASVGGLRGIAEAIVPALVFLVTFIVTTDIWISAIWAVGLAALASVLRLIQRQPMTQALAGVIGVAVSAGVALMQDDARGYYVIGFYISAAYGLAFALSMAVKWPVMGLIYGWIRGEGVSWQKQPARRKKYQIATLLMVLV